MKSIFVAGHLGMVGSAIVRTLREQGAQDIVGRSHAELELTNQAAVRDFFSSEMPDQVYLAAARVGGIYANSRYPAEFIYDNLMVQANVIHEAWRAGVQKLLFLGSSCIYPRLAPQPMSEDALLTGPLEPSNEPYAVAKIAGIKMCESYNRQYGTDYRSVMPTNLYGPGDNYHVENSHVIPALIRRFHDAKLQGAERIVIWGTGEARREFLFVDDMAEAAVMVMQMDKATYEAHTLPMRSHVNIGSGEDISVRELAMKIGKVVGTSCRIEFDASKPDGSPRKLLDASRIRALGWKNHVGLDVGLSRTYEHFLASHRK